jgi:hypothetical protein
MTILAIILLACAAFVALCVLPLLLSMAFELLPLIIAIVIALAIYGWLT